jgi:hypothetical protein
MIRWLFNLIKSGDEVIESATIEVDGEPLVQVNRYNKNNRDVIIATPSSSRNATMDEANKYVNSKLK